MAREMIIPGGGGLGERRRGDSARGAAVPEREGGV